MAQSLAGQRKCFFVNVEIGEKPVDRSRYNARRSRSGQVLALRDRAQV
jgi:hypothetical protein